MHDMGLMRSKPDITAKQDETKEKYYPTLQLSEEQAPFLKGLKIGDTIKAVFQLRVKGVREAYEWSDSKSPQYDIELQKCEEEST